METQRWGWWQSTIITACGEKEGQTIKINIFGDWDTTWPSVGRQDKRGELVLLCQLQTKWQEAPVLFFWISIMLTHCAPKESTHYPEKDLAINFLFSLSLSTGDSGTLHWTTTLALLIFYFLRFSLAKLRGTQLAILLQSPRAFGFQASTSTCLHFSVSKSGTEMVSQREQMTLSNVSLLWNSFYFDCCLIRQNQNGHITKSDMLI